MTYVLCCEPGRTLPDKRPITILQLGSEDGLDEAMALDLRETQCLLKLLLIALATHDPDACEEIVGWYHQLVDGDDEDENGAEDSTVIGGRFLVAPPQSPIPPPEQEHQEPPQPANLAEATRPEISRRPATQRSTPRDPRRPRAAKPTKRGVDRPFSAALRDRHVKVRFEGEESFRRFGLLGGFIANGGVLLACRRRVPKAGGRGNRVEDFLLQTSVDGRQASFLGRTIMGRPVTEKNWRRMEAAPAGGWLVVNGLRLKALDVLDCWAYCRRRIFSAGCTFEQWR